MNVLVVQKFIKRNKELIYAGTLLVSAVGLGVAHGKGMESLTSATAVNAEAIKAIHGRLEKHGDEFDRQQKVDYEHAVVIQRINTQIENLAKLVDKIEQRMDYNDEGKRTGRHPSRF